MRNSLRTSMHKDAIPFKFAYRTTIWHQVLCLWNGWNALHTQRNAFIGFRQSLGQSEFKLNGNVDAPNVLLFICLLVDFYVIRGTSDSIDFAESANQLFGQTRVFCSCFIYFLGTVVVFVIFRSSSFSCFFFFCYSSCCYKHRPNTHTIYDTFVPSAIIVLLFLFHLHTIGCLHIEGKIGLTSSHNIISSVNNNKYATVYKRNSNTQTMCFFRAYLCTTE